MKRSVIIWELHPSINGIKALWEKPRKNVRKVTTHKTTYIPGTEIYAQSREQVRNVYLNFEGQMKSQRHHQNWFCTYHVPYYLFERAAYDLDILDMMFYGCTLEKCKPKFIRRVRGTVWKSIANDIIKIEKAYEERLEACLDEMSIFLNYIKNYKVVFSYKKVDQCRICCRYGKYTDCGTLEKLLSEIRNPSCWDFNIHSAKLGKTQLQENETSYPKFEKLCGHF